MADKTYNVTVATGQTYTGGSGNVYFFDGVRYLSFKWVPGATLRLDQSEATNDNHPLVFSTTTGLAGIISSGVSYYLDGSSNQANYTNTTTFNAATTRYVEITASSFSDFYYLCYVHGISMGGDMDMVNNSWSANAWGDNAWNSTTSNIPVTGQLLTTVLGDEVSFPGSGWGANGWNVGEWGSVNTGNQLVTGFGLSANLGTVDQTSSTGWGRNTWGSNIWNGFGTVIPTGVSMSMSVGDELIDTDINRGWGRKGWNVDAWGIGGQTLANNFSLPMTLASVSIDNQVNTGWGSDGWGVEGWGESILTVTPTGIAMTAFEGSAGLSFDGDSNVDAVGRAMTAALGEESINIKVGPILTGFPLTMQLTFDSPTVIPTGIALTATLGDEASEFKTIAEVNAFSPGYWGYRSTWGFSAWGNGQTNTLVMSMLENFSGADPEPDAEATGQAMAIALAAGDTFDITGDANIAPLAAMHWGDGTWGESTWGDGLYRPDTDDIFPITATLGTAVLDAVTSPTITGLGVQQVRVGNVTVTGTGVVIPTGNNLTMGQGTGTNVLIWNAVDTGSAPTTPPGWQEVPTNAA
tara:strand:+ start:32 stop:1768 length:1737 start_codon:yes stop_codon:yes gene_type:complete